MQAIAPLNYTFGLANMKAILTLKLSHKTQRTQTMAIFKTLPLKDNTDGFRFDGLGIKGLYRKRLTKRRYGIGKGETMRHIHIGKRSFYLELRKPHRRLHDFALKHWAREYTKVFRIDTSRSH